MGLLFVGDPSPSTPVLFEDHLLRTTLQAHQVAFYMQGEGCLLLPRSSTGTILLELRPEAGYTCAPFASTLGVNKKMYATYLYCMLLTPSQVGWANFQMNIHTLFIQTGLKI